MTDFPYFFYVTFLTSSSYLMNLKRRGSHLKYGAGLGEYASKASPSGSAKMCPLGLWLWPASGPIPAMNLYAILYKWQYHNIIHRGPPRHKVSSRCVCMYVCCVCVCVLLYFWSSPHPRQLSLSPEHTHLMCQKPFHVYYFLFSTSFQLHSLPRHNTPFSVSVKRTIDYYYNFIVCEQ